MKDVVAAGHICLDILPDLSMQAAGQFETAFQPGRLVHTGPAVLSTGGSVSNTGLALNRLGIETRLLARVGADHFGTTIKELLSGQSPGLGDGITSSAGTSTSYSIVISPPGSDRLFLHHPGANDDFCAGDVRDEAVRDCRLFHFGYPPIMARMFADGGAQLAEIFRRVKSLGLTTSLDMAYPDPGSPAGRADWRAILARTLPFVDVFLPSLDEILFMLGYRLDLPLSARLLNEVSGDLLGMGAKMVVLKLGERGLYLRVSSGDRWDGVGRACPSDRSAWQGYEAWLPCFGVPVVGTTGSGDTTIAGFLAGLLHDLPPTEALTAALAVGACNVEAADSVSGIRTWEDTWQRIHAGWARRDEPGQFIRRVP